MSEKQFEKDIKGKLGDYHSPIDAEALWADLELKEEKKDRGIFWWFFGSATILVLLAGFYLISTNQEIRHNNDALSAELKELKQSKATKIEKQKANSSDDAESIQGLNEDIKTEAVAKRPKNKKTEFKKQSKTTLKNKVQKPTQNYSSKPLFSKAANTHSATAAKTKTQNTNPVLTTKNEIKSNPASSAKLSVEPVKTIKKTTHNPLTDMVNKLPLPLRALDNDPVIFKMSKRKAMKLLSPLKEKGKLELMLNFNPYYAHKRLFTDSEFYRQLIDLNRETESYQNAYSVGLGVRKTLPNGLRVTAGVAFDQLTEVFKESKDLGISSFFDSTAINAVRISDEEIIDTSFGAFKTYQTTSYQEIYNRYKSISIPISIGYFKRKGAWAYYGDVGIVYNIRRWQRGQAYTNGDVEIRLARFDNESHHINDKKNTGLHLTAGFGVSKQISHRWSWAAGPHIQYGINSWTDGWPLDIRYTNIGINTSMSFTF